MKNRKYHVDKTEAYQTFPLSKGTGEDLVGTKVLYNWLYQQEEKDYYLNDEISSFLPDLFLQEALFVEH